MPRAMPGRWELILLLTIYNITISQITIFKISINRKYPSIDFSHKKPDIEILVSKYWINRYFGQENEILFNNLFQCRMRVKTDKL